MAMLKFSSFTSDIEIPFYHSLASHKVDHDKLDDSARRVLGIYELRPSDKPAASCRMQLRGNALTSDEVPSNCYRAEGTIKNYNTIEEYRASDKAAIIDRAGRTIWDAISDGTIFSCPSLLASFNILCFSDLKKYKFTYLFGYPALHSEPVWTVLTCSKPDPSPSKHLSADESVSLVDAVQTWRYGNDARQWGFFLAKTSTQPAHSSDDHFSTLTGPSHAETLLGSNWTIGSLGEYEQGFFTGVPDSNRFICFADPSTYEDYPGWPLRNLLVLVRRRWRLSRIQILCYRDIQARRHEARSIIIEVECKSSTADDVLTVPKVTGWERGSSGKVASKIAKLDEYMDPTRLADQAVDLNLKLMKWRIAPTLDLEVIKDTKCLLLGAGTLGSYVSRNLMGWGVRHITFVDNGNVSFSNPVRQPLFNFEDCLGGGVSKADRAAAVLREIYPGIVSSGYNISVPMAGHPILDEIKSLADYQKLHQLFSEHDAIFLLMDTRESRWLPTVMGKAMGKLVMNAALGFDTYFVMRHGLADQERPGTELGCYFCNDVVAPADSVSDRTLDQQCTVTRPGVAAIASALLVELMVSVLQERSLEKAGVAGVQENPLGEVPHTIRGFLNQWNTINVKGSSYSQCSACSQIVLQSYRENGWEFVKKALNEKDYVAELSGLAELQRQAELAAADLDWDDEEETGVADFEDEGELL